MTYPVHVCCVWYRIATVVETGEESEVNNVPNILITIRPKI